MDGGAGGDASGGGGAGVAGGARQVAQFLGDDLQAQAVLGELVIGEAGHGLTGEGLAGDLMDGGLAGEGLPAADGHIDVEWANFHRVAAASKLLGGDNRGA